VLGYCEAFEAAKLRQMYPGGKREYLKQFNIALKAAVRRGFILRADVREIQALAAEMYNER
jgi:hypothetical protein